jgi:hypothetical protein
MESPTKVSGKMVCVKALVLKLGLMVANMLDNGQITKQMEREFYIIQMETSMKENG